MTSFCCREGEDTERVQAGSQVTCRSTSKQKQTSEGGEDNKHTTTRIQMGVNVEISSHELNHHSPRMVAEVLD